MKKQSGNASELDIVRSFILRLLSVPNLNKS